MVHMKKKKRLFGILLIIAALIIVQLPKSEVDAAASASDFQIEGATLVKYWGTEKNVSVPNTVEVIGEDAFENNDNIEKVTLPDSVNRIEAYAFWGCDNLKTVILGKGLSEVGDFTFTNCKGLEEMKLPANIRTVGIQAFADCVNLANITIPPEVTNIHDTAFNGCKRLVLHCETGSYADKYAQSFYEKQLEMPEYEDVSNYNPDDNEENIQDDNPWHNTPDSAAGSLLGSTTVVGNRAVVFIDNTSPTVFGGTPVNQVQEEQQPQEMRGDGLPKYTIVDGTLVADQAYYRSRNLENVALPQGIREIGQFAYARSSLKSIEIPEGTEKIGYGAFYHCSSLREVTLPESLKVIEPKAFTHTAWVSEFLSGTGSAGAGSMVKEGADGDFLISGGALIAYRGSASAVEIPQGVRLIAAEAFEGHTEIASVTCSDSLSVIGEGAFAGCSSLELLVLGKGVTDIKDRAFQGCPLGDVTLPASMEHLGLQAFDGQTVLHYQGQVPQTTHEDSAERLSNEEYRAPGADGKESGVEVRGMRYAEASLEGAKRYYTLNIRSLTQDTEEAALMQTAFNRAGLGSMPADILLYDCKLQDSSQIPISRLGRQILTVTLPLPDDMAGENVQVVTMDRNGQLEQLSSQRLQIEGRDSVRFSTNHLTVFGIYRDGEALSPQDIIQELTVTNSQSMAPPQAGGGRTVFSSGAAGSIPYQWIFGGIMLTVGVFFVFKYQ